MATATELRSRGGAVRKALLMAGALAFIALLFFGLVREAPDTGIDEALAQGQTPPAPGFSLPLLDAGPDTPAAELPGGVDEAFADGAVELSELRGTPVVLNFWASWCAPCREEAPLLEDAWRSGRDDGVLVLGLNQHDLSGDAANFLRELGLSYPSVRDEGNGVAVEWGVTGLPETFFLTAEGKVAGHVIGVVSGEQLEAGIAAARSGTPLGSVSGGEQRPVE